MIRPLIFIPSPREVEQFKQATSKLPYDKLWVKNLPEINAYYQGRKYFLDHEEYTHLIILPDDLIVTPQDIEKLLQNADMIEVLSGYCENTIRQMWNYEGPPEEQPDSNISLILPPSPPMSGTYSAYDFMSLRFIDCLNKTGEHIIKIRYSGFAPTIISRAVIEKIPFRSEYCCVDSCFSTDIHKAGIEQYCDLRVKTEHLELRQKGPADLNVGKKEGKIYLESA